MNWRYWRLAPWIDTRAAFVARTPRGGRLLDLGTSDGSTLRHFAELRPDLNFAAVDLKKPAELPQGCEFSIVNLERDRLPWADEQFDAMTCMHLVEHLDDASLLWRECARVLRHGGRLYMETPGPLSLTAKTITGPAAGTVTMNFHDDPTHTSLVRVERMRSDAEGANLRVERTGVSRNMLFTIAYPFLTMLRPGSRERYVAKLHWMGWSHFVVVSKP